MLPLRLISSSSKRFVDDDDDDDEPALERFYSSRHFGRIKMISITVAVDTKVAMRPFKSAAALSKVKLAALHSVARLRLDGKLRIKLRV